MTLYFNSRQVFGNDLKYPVDRVSQGLVEMMGRKTLDDFYLIRLHQLGFQIILDNQEYKLP